MDDYSNDNLIDQGLPARKPCSAGAGNCPGP